MEQGGPTESTASTRRRRKRGVKASEGELARSSAAYGQGRAPLAAGPTVVHLAAHAWAVHVECRVVILTFIYLILV